MSVRYTLRHLNAADCTPDNIKLYELVATKDTGHVLFRQADGVIVDLTQASAEYAIKVAEQITAKATALEKLINDFVYTGDEILAQAQAIADNTKTSENNAFTYSGIAKESEEKALVSSNLAKAWAVETGSPDGEADADSPTAKTQSSRTWALAAKQYVQIYAEQYAAEKVAEALAKKMTTHTLVVTYEDNTTETINILGVNS